MNIDPALLEALPPAKRKLLEESVALLSEITAGNPLETFHSCPRFCGSPHCEAPDPDRNPTGGRPLQNEYMTAQDRIVAAFAGNRFGKTIGNVGWAIIQHTPDDMLPDRLKPMKRHRPMKLKGVPVVGRYLLPSQKAIQTIVLPELRRLCPPVILRGGQWNKAWSTQHNILFFEDGGRLEFYTYEQDPAVMVGASLDYVIYDEPPPEGHYRENVIRTTDRSGCHRFGLTPVNMKGGGIGWLKREIFDRADPEHEEYNPHLHIVRASIWDNPSLSREEIEFTLAQFPEDERQAREHGDFVHFGGMIYPGGFRRVVVENPAPADLRNRDIIVGIDPGLKNAAFIWVAFDEDNRALVFDEWLLQEKTPIDYARLIRKVNSLWELGPHHGNAPIYVADPSIRNRSLTNAESVQTELMRQGIPTVNGQNDVQAGVQQIRRRIQEGGFFVADACKKLRLEADEYRMDDTDDGEFKVVKENDHRLDAMRYALMARPWYREYEAKLRAERWKPGTAPSLDWLMANANKQNQYGKFD